MPDLEIIDARDASARIVRSSVCGSDPHLLGGYAPVMKPGDIIGPELLGEIVELGSSLRNQGLAIAQVQAQELQRAVFMP